MTKKRKTTLAVILFLAVILIAGGVLLASSMVNSRSYGVQLGRGDKFLAQADYTNAVLAYQSAIAADPAQAEGYIGLANAYIKQDKMSLAQTALNTGFSKTGSARLKLMLQIYFPATEALEEGTGGEEEKKVENQAFDRGIFELLAYNTYDDYRRNGQIETEGQEGGGYSVSTNIAGATMQFYSTPENSHVIDTNTGKPFSAARPNIITLENITTLFGGGTVPYEVLSKAQLAELKITEDEENGYILSFICDGCKVRICCDEDGTIHPGVYNLIEPSVAKEVTGAIEVSGSVVSAVTGGGVSNATMNIYEGTNTAGEPLMVVTSESNGNYDINLDAGRYTVEIECGGYTTESFALTVSSYREATTESFTLSPTLSAGEIRIVLEWGAYPADLDSWLTGSTDSGTDVVVSYRNRQVTGAGGTVAQLDVDDTTGYGPETTTIYDSNGVYEFAVVDYRSTGGLSASGATVKIYLPDQSEPIIVNVCEGLEYGWSVCTIDHGTVKVTNTTHPTHAGAIK